MASPGLVVQTRPYNATVRLSLIGFGGIVLLSSSQKRAQSVVGQAFDAGVNYFDVAPLYGDGEAERKLGLALAPYRDSVFLACKTMQRTAKGAEQELHRSLRRLKTDHIELYQFHAVTRTDEVEEIFANDGAMKTFLTAREAGKIRYIGFSAHSEEAALAMMDRYSFDSVLFPVNFVCSAQGNFGPRVLSRARELGVARLALKSLAYTPWPFGEKHTHPKCWYKPVDDPDLARLALRFTLSEDVTAALPPGDEQLFRLALTIARTFTPLTARERGSLQTAASTLQPLFTSY